MPIAAILAQGRLCEKSLLKMTLHGMGSANLLNKSLDCRQWQSKPGSGETCCSHCYCLHVGSVRVAPPIPIVIFGNEFFTYSCRKAISLLMLSFKQLMRLAMKQSTSMHSRNVPMSLAHSVEVLRRPFPAVAVISFSGCLGSFSGLLCIAALACLLAGPDDALLFATPRRDRQQLFGGHLLRGCYRGESFRFSCSF